jgi:hypothetical protein
MQTGASCNLCAPVRCFEYDQNRNIGPGCTARPAPQSAGARQQPVEHQFVTLYVSDRLNLLNRRQFSGHTVRNASSFAGEVPDQSYWYGHGVARIEGYCSPIPVHDQFS